ncbi:hypothetical protein V6N11_066808 [Hibiscus sabdariffa]|uniref:Uncharacterized protein n=1 Tax=Hibiscus sabdariffa TaxID=183260 RepID=A0ABR2SNX5_9ROSI
MSLSSSVEAVGLLMIGHFSNHEPKGRTLLKSIDIIFRQKDMGDFRFSSDCAAHNGKSLSEISSDRKQDVADSCSQMILQLQDVYDPEKVNVGIKIVPRSPDGIIAANSVKLESK